jgi:hypothetical protein
VAERFARLFYFGGLVTEQIRAELFQSLATIPLGTYGPGVYEQKINSQGNSLLSSLFVKLTDIGATLTVEYLEATTGDEEGEDYVLDTHVIPPDGQTNKIIVSRIHNKPRIRATVTGGNVRFGVYISVVSSFASDLDNALVTNGQTADLATALGLQTAIYDPVAGKFFFARGSSGIQDVNVVGFDETALPFSILSTSGLQTTPNVAQTAIISIAVPMGKKWKIRQVLTVSRCYGEFDILVDGTSVGGGVTSPMEANARFEFMPYYLATAGQVVSLDFIENHGPICNLRAVLQYTEEDA